VSARVALLVAVAAPVMAGGCGGGTSDQRQIESTVTSYYTAFASGDGAAACTRLSKTAVKLLEASAGGRKCPQVLADALKRPAYARIAPKLKAVKVLVVRVSGPGNTATATARVPGAGANGASVSTTVPLKKEDGAWKIVSTSGGG
jgi:ketosteroid isomerase-like protein